MCSSKRFSKVFAACQPCCVDNKQQFKIIGVYYFCKKITSFFQCSFFSFFFSMNKSFFAELFFPADFHRKQRKILRFAEEVDYHIVTQSGMMEETPVMLPLHHNFQVCRSYGYPIQPSGRHKITLHTGDSVGST